jgi:hypothetical protein
MRARQSVRWIGQQVVNSCHRRDEVAEAFDEFQKLPSGWSEAFQRFLLDLTIIEARDDVRLINIADFSCDRIQNLFRKGIVDDDMGPRFGDDILLPAPPLASHFLPRYKAV